MKLRFWKKSDSSDDEATVIKVTKGLAGNREIYVSAQTPEKALELYHELKKEETGER